MRSFLQNKLGVWNLDQMCSNENYNNVYQTTIVASLDARSIFYISFYVPFKPQLKSKLPTPSEIASFNFNSSASLLEYGGSFK